MIYFGYIYIFLFVISRDSKVNRRANTFELMCTEDGEIKGWKLNRGWELAFYVVAMVRCYCVSTLC